MLCMPAPVPFLVNNAERSDLGLGLCPEAHSTRVYARGAHVRTCARTYARGVPRPAGG